MTEKTSPLYRFLGLVERAGNALPHPAIMFLGLSFFVILISAFVSSLGIQSIHPVTKETITTINLLSGEGVRYIMTHLVKNFTNFAPLGTVLVAMLGFSVAEKSGLLSSLLRVLVLKSPKKLLVPAVLFAGVLSHTGGDIGYVLLIPLAAMAFHSAGLNPLAGLAICFAGVSGGFAANLLLSTADPLLSGISQQAARIIDADYIVTPLSNYYFMASSSLLIVGIGTFIANKITIPFLGEYKGSEKSSPLEKLNPLEKKGLIYAGLTLLSLILLILICLIPENGILRDPKSNSLLHSTALKGVVPIIFLASALPGIVYGYVTKNFKNQNDVIGAMQDGMMTMAPYIVLVFFASQFIEFFSFSNIGLIMAVEGSSFLRELGLGPISLMLGFVILTVLLDLVIGSASAKWALMAPVFVPMFMLLGISPELSQASYRVADSVVNIISPLMSFFPLILSFAIKYDPKAKVGTVIALMLPYTIGFLIFWSLMLFTWMSFDLPLGPGAPLKYIAP